MRRLVVAAVAVLVGCGDDVSDDGATGSSSSMGSAGTTSTAADGSAESMQPCESEDSRFTVFLDDASVTAFVLEIDDGNFATTVTCPASTIDGSFALRVECGTGQATLFEPGDFPTMFVRIAVDDGPLESVAIECNNTSMCPKQGRNACETRLGDADSTSSST